MTSQYTVYFQRFKHQRPAKVAKGASQFLNSGGQFSLAPGFSPVMTVEKHREAVLAAFRCAGKPVETGFILVTTNFTRLKPGANERRSKTEMHQTQPSTNLCFASCSVPVK
jgi:hypothetical protein